MKIKIYDEIKNRINAFSEGKIFFTSDFKDIASLSTIRKCLGRQVEEGKIRRIMDGIYDKPKFNILLNEYVAADPDNVAHAIAGKYHWTISPCGDAALNLLGLSTQVPAVWSYISDGPYKEYSWDNVTISFLHRTNRQISLMSDLSVMVVEAFKTLGKERVDDEVIFSLSRRLTREEKIKLLEETNDVASWIYEKIRKVCS